METERRRPPAASAHRALPHATYDHCTPYNTFLRHQLQYHPKLIPNIKKFKITTILIQANICNTLNIYERSNDTSSDIDRVESSVTKRRKVKGTSTGQFLSVVII